MKRSAGIICYYRIDEEFKFLLGFPGGPFYCNYDKKGNLISYKNEYNQWSILKGGIDGRETKKEAALREFKEESGIDLSNRKKELISLGFIRYKSGKRVYAYGINAFLETNKMSSNKCKMEISGSIKEFPEIEKYKYMTIEECKSYCNKSQFELIERLNNLIGN